MDYEYVGERGHVETVRCCRHTPKLQTTLQYLCWSYEIRTRAQIYRPWIACVSVAVDPQLAEVVPSPAHDAASSDEGTGMESSQG